MAASLDGVEGGLDMELFVPRVRFSIVIGNGLGMAYHSPGTTANVNEPVSVAMTAEDHS